MTGFGIVRRGDGADTLGQLVHEELDLVGVARRDLVHLFAHVVGHALIAGQRQRMHLHPVGEDELHARQADAVVGDRRLLEGNLGAAHIHHDLGAWPRHVAHIDRLHLERQLPGVDAANLTLGAAHGDFLARFQKLRGVAAAHDGRNAQFTRHDGGVARAPATVGHDGRGRLHDRFPVRVGDVGHQDFASLEVADVAHVGDDAYLAGRDLLAHGQTLDQHIALAFEPIGLES